MPSIFAPSERRPWRALALALLLPAALPASAGAQRLAPTHTPTAYTQECGACHTAYPPGLLPAASWQRLLAGLDRHYGVDASLDATTTAALSSWLQWHAGSSRRAREEPPQDRITRAAWFQREHRKVAPEVWQLPSVGSAARCGACHGGAARGEFDEHDLRLPAGLDRRGARAWHD